MCQIVKKRDKMGIMEKVNENKTKENSVVFSILKEQKSTVRLDPDF